MGHNQKPKVVANFLKLFRNEISFLIFSDKYEVKNDEPPDEDDNKTRGRHFQILLVDSEGGGRFKHPPTQNLWSDYSDSFLNMTKVTSILSKVLVMTIAGTSVSQSKRSVLMNSRYSSCPILTHMSTRGAGWPIKLVFAFSKYQAWLVLKPRMLKNYFRIYNFGRNVSLTQLNIQVHCSSIPPTEKKPIRTKNTKT